MQKEVSHIRIRDFPNEEKPREKLAKYGVSSLSNAELLALILGKGTRNRNVVDLSNDLLRTEGLSRLSKKGISELCSVEGIGFAKACQIIACFELGKRLASHSSKETPLITCAEEAYVVLSPLLRAQDRENFIALFLDVKKRLIRHELLFIGTLDCSIIHPREIFKAAVKESAAAIIIAHNHPSGNPEPSMEDLKVTRQLIKAGQIIGIPLLDHIIIGENSYESLRSSVEIGGEFSN